MKVNKLSLIILILTIFSYTLCSTARAETREIIDMAGRTVIIPKNVKKIACIQGPSYESVFAMGGKDKIHLVRAHHKKSYPLANLTNPDLINCQIISKIGPKSPVNIEEFLRIGPEVIIYWNIPSELKKFEAAGMSAVVLNWSSGAPQNIQEAIADQKKKMKVLAGIIGDGAIERYHKWSNYFDEKVSFISGRLADLKDSRRPGCYIGNSWGNNILSTWGSFNSNQYTIALCGGKFRGVKGPGQFPEISREQLLAWSPDYIIVDNHGHNPHQVIKDLKTSQDWASLPAVKNDNIYRIPSGVFFLDKGTSAPLFYLWLAQKLHPDRFKDIDMVNEIKFYFRNFYDYKLTTQEAEHALNS